jgi:hypothetical protein
VKKVSEMEPVVAVVWEISSISSEWVAADNRLKVVLRRLNL